MALPFDLDEPLLRQSEVLEIVPDLTAGRLQNWIARGVIETPPKEKHAKLYWSPVAVIGLHIMVELTNLSVKPTVAHDVAEQLLGHLDEFIDRIPRNMGDEGFEKFDLPMEKRDVQRYRRFSVKPYSHDGDDLVTLREFGTNDMSAEWAAIVVCTDLIFAFGLNWILRIIHHRTGDAK